MNKAGPQTADAIRTLYRDLEAQYPDAEILGGTLEDIATEVKKAKPLLSHLGHWETSSLSHSFCFFLCRSNKHHRTQKQQIGIIQISHDLRRGYIAAQLICRSKRH